MKWVAVAGSWRTRSKKIERDVSHAVSNIMAHGDGVVSGGALGVDYFATERALLDDPLAKKIKIFLPASLETYTKHLYKRATEGVITRAQAEMLINQLKKIKKLNQNAIIENPENMIISKEVYFSRIADIVEAADKLLAFQVNGSEGTQHTIDLANQKGIPVEVFSYAA